MPNSSFITPNILHKNPRLINEVQGKTDNPVDKMKEQLKHLRRYYRFIRDTNQSEWNNLAGKMELKFRTKTLIPIELATLIEKIIVKKMKSKFGMKYYHLIELAAFIEKTIVFIPHNQIPRWVIVPFEAVYSLVYHALTTTGNQRSAMRLLTAYLWHEFAKDEDITPPSDVVSCSGLYKENFKEDLKSKFHVHIQHTRRRVRLIKEPRTSWTIHWNDLLPVEGITYEDVLNCTSHTRVIGSPPIPTSLEREFSRHQLYYPQSPFQWLDKDLLLILSDGIYATIPLIKGIVPLLIAHLVNKHALHEWLRQGGVDQPSKKIESLYKYADKAVRELNGTVKYERPGMIKFKLAPRTYLGEFWMIQDEIMQRGILIDPSILRTLKPPTVPNKDTKWNQEHIKKLNDIKEGILKAIKPTNGWYRGIYSLESHSERVHYKRNPVQGYPLCFKAAVIAPEHYQLVHIDITANDLSILFNLAQDKTGLLLLQTGNDPYEHLATAAFPGQPVKTARKMVKEVVNPWIYSAGVNTIISSGEIIDKSDARVVINAIKQEFPTVADWITRLDRIVKANRTIPAHLNPVDGTDIPMPSAFSRRLAPSFLIQRVGASILKQAVVRLHSHAFSSAKILLTVHDSILMKALIDDEPLPEMEATQAIEYGMQRTPGITHLTVKVGRGPTWEQAEQAAVRTTCRTK